MLRGMLRSSCKRWAAEPALPSQPQTTCQVLPTSLSAGCKIAQTAGASPLRTQRPRWLETRNLQTRTRRMLLAAFQMPFRSNLVWLILDMSLRLLKPGWGPRPAGTEMPPESQGGAAREHAPLHSLQHIH